MATFDTRTLRRQGADLANENRPAAKRLVLIYSGALALLTLGINGLYLVLDKQIGGTGGLDGMGLRSVLQTIEEVLTYVNIFFGPFWAAGFLWAMMSMVRGRTPRPVHLMAGFRCFGRVLAYLAFQFLIVVALLAAAVNVASVIFAFTPMGTEFAELMAPVLNDPNLITASGAVDLELLPVGALTVAVIPMVILTLVLFLPLYIWLSYGFRLALYLVLDGSTGVQSYFKSMRLMRGHKWQMLKLDLGFWWYYALLGLAVVVGYLDLILELLGISVPIDATVMYFVTMGAYCLLQIAITLWKKCPVDATYALAYEAIITPDPTLAEAE